MKNAIYLLKKSQNENTTQSAKIRVVCDQFIKGIQDIQYPMDKNIAQLVENKEKLGTENFVNNFKL